MVLGKDQRGFWLAGRALIIIASPVKGFTPLPALRALTSLRPIAPMIGKRTRSPLAACLMLALNVSSIAFLRSVRFMRTSPLLETVAVFTTFSWSSLMKENLPDFLVAFFVVLAIDNSLHFLKLYCASGKRARSNLRKTADRSSFF